MINTINPPKKKAANIGVDKLRTFEGHPFQVLDDEDMEVLTESIKEQGILCPLIVRPIENTDEYEVVSGHRRLHAAIKAGLSEVPVLIYPLDRKSFCLQNENGGNESTGQTHGLNFIASCDKVGYRRRNRQGTRRKP